MQNGMEKVFRGHVVDVERRRVFDGAVIVENGVIKDIVEAQGIETDAPYIMPGFIDSHVHIESTLLIPENYARVAVHQGSVASICDPHEIANVLGVDGVEFMVRNGRKVRFNFCFGVPSCVPCTTNETNGATIDSKDVAKLIVRPEFYGLAEMMNFVGLDYKDPEVLAKMQCARDAGKVIDGHGPGLGGRMAKLMADSGISCDHELDDLGLARERIGLGMKVQIREGSAACNFDELIPLLADDESRGLTMFCTDDKYPDEFHNGYINELAARAVARGYDLWRVLETACVTPVKHFNTGTGLLQKGDKANFITVADLKDFYVLSTVIDGVTVMENGHTTPEITIDPSSPDAEKPNNFKASEISAADIQIRMRGKRIKVINATEGSLFTKATMAEPLLKDGMVQSDTGRDLLKVVVYNRYQEKARPAVSVISGFGLKQGALASTIAHDSHNIIALGVSDDDIVTAINAVVSSKGGLCVVKDGQAHILELPVAGLMSTRPGKEVGIRHTELKELAHQIGCPFNAPFMTLAFMALPPIPELKITDKGLFDVAKFAFTSRFEFTDDTLFRLYHIFLDSNGVTTDSRACGPGLMFFALKGERFNGNEFAAKALEQGCVCAVVDDPAFYDAADSRMVLVENVLSTLQKLACMHRCSLGTKVLGITGTNGKTTTKELVAAVLGTTYNILYTKGNLNNSIGVPLTVLGLKPEHQFAVVEMGASHPGDIKELVEVCRPDWGLITNVGKAHLLGFGSFEGVMATKGELYDFLRENGGRVFVNHDNQWLQQMSAGLDKTEYGRPSNVGTAAEPGKTDVAEGLAVEGDVLECNPFVKMRWRAGSTGEWHTVQTKLIGSYNVDNALAAATVGLSFGVSEADIDRALAGYEPSNNRSQLTVTEHNSLVVDAYNANPTSMAAALENFSLMKADAKVLVLGDMRELGEASASEHASVLGLIEKYGFKEVYLVGAEFKAASAGKGILCFDMVEDLAGYLDGHPLEGRTILIKGSNSIHLTKLVEKL